MKRTQLRPNTHWTSVILVCIVSMTINACGLKDQVEINRGSELISGIQNKNDSQHTTQVKIPLATEQLNYGVDVCAYTGDVINTTRYGGQMIFKNGDRLSFKSVEATAAYFLQLSDPSNVESLMIVDFAHGKQLMPVNDLKYLRSPLRPSPDGLFLTAVDASNTRMLGFIYDAYPGTYLTWNEVLNVVSNEMDIQTQQTNSTIRKNRAEK